MKLKLTLGEALCWCGGKRSREGQEESSWPPDWLPPPSSLSLPASFVSAPQVSASSVGTPCPATLGTGVFPNMRGACTIMQLTPGHQWVIPLAGCQPWLALLHSPHSTSATIKSYFFKKISGFDLSFFCHLVNCTARRNTMFGVGAPFGGL